MGLWLPLPASRSSSAGVLPHWIMVLQAGVLCPEATSRWIQEWKRKSGFPHGLSPSFTWLCPPASSEDGKPGSEPARQAQATVPQRKLTLAQAHGFLGFLGSFSLATLFTPTILCGASCCLRVGLETSQYAEGGQRVGANSHHKNCG